jgi:hypothetical protein
MVLVSHSQCIASPHCVKPEGYSVRRRIKTIPLSGLGTQFRLPRKAIPQKKDSPIYNPNPSSLSYFSPKTALHQLKPRKTTHLRDDKRIISWYYYLEEVLEFPFQAYISVKKPKEKEATRVLVSVRAMADVDLCSIYNMWVQVQAQDVDLHFNVPMRDILEAKAGEQTIEALIDWRYWIKNF